MSPLLQSGDLWRRQVRRADQKEAIREQAPHEALEDSVNRRLLQVDADVPAENHVERHGLCEQPFYLSSERLPIAPRRTRPCTPASLRLNIGQHALEATADSDAPSMSGIGDISPPTTPLSPPKCPDSGTKHPQRTRAPRYASLRHPKPPNRKCPPASVHLRQPPSPRAKASGSPN